MKQLLYCLYISVFCCFYSCQRESVAEYRMEQVDSIHISYYGNRLNSYVCIDNQEDIDSLCDIIYNSTTKYVSQFYPNMEISLYGNNQKQVFGVSKEYLKGHFGAKSIYNLEEILKRIYNAHRGTVPLCSQGDSPLVSTLCYILLTHLFY